MDKRITIAFWAIDILLLAGPFVMPGIPIEVAWFAVVMAAGMLVYSLFPRRLLPPQWRGESPSFDAGKHPMTKATLLGLSPGSIIDGLRVSSNRVLGYDEVKLVDVGEGAKITEGEVTDNEVSAPSSPSEQKASP
jgi:hypothetical protein